MVRPALKYMSFSDNFKENIIGYGQKDMKSLKIIQTINPLSPENNFIIATEVLSCKKIRGRMA
ncbi:MAG TPA: hypothetical protein PK661_02280 [Syntrophorhabdaceae bacterium]|jgi:hypothetical protein|nr:hypothetical protein [Syntrophorhabdaceae bacterium]HPH40992.1 hypothetical protein [Syntrophorhabdaceae bacterium]